MPTLIQSNTELFTFRDVVEYLFDTHELDTREGIAERRARASVLKAYRDLPARHSWHYFYRQRLLQTVAPYSTGTVVYDHTGGANERMLTLTSGTWPDWAAYGRVILSGVTYEVDTRESATIITLTSTSNPGADVASTTYEIYRSAYLLPADFRSMCRVWDVDEQRALKFLDPAQGHSQLITLDTPGNPTEAYIRATGEYYGGMQLHFGPPPDSAKTYDILYMAWPRRLSIDEYSTGTVTITSGSATVTGTGTTFPTNCVGAVIRFSSTSALPSPIMGGLGGTDNPFAMQGVIKTRTSATALVLEENADTTIAAGSAYVISDPIDIEPGAMLTAFLKSAEAEFCLRAGRKDQQLKLSLAREAIKDAIEADSRYENLGVLPSYDPFTRTTANE